MAFQDVTRLGLPPFQSAKTVEELARMLGEEWKRLVRAIDQARIAGEKTESDTALGFDVLQTLHHDHSSEADGGTLSRDRHNSYSRWDVTATPTAATDAVFVAAVDFAAGDARLQVVSETGEKVWIGNGAIRSAANAFTVDAAAALNLGTAVATSTVVGRTGTNTTLAGDNILVGGGTSASEVRFLEPSASGTNYTAFKAQAQAANLTYTLPPSQTAGQLTNDGAGSLTWAASSAPSAATQAEQETGSATNVYVSPGRQQYHASAAKGWSMFTDAGSTVSYNVSSVTNVGTGQNTVNWGTDFSTANYAIALGVETGLLFVSGGGGSRAAGSLDVLTEDAAGVDTAATTNIVAYGDQA